MTTTGTSKPGGLISVQGLSPDDTVRLYRIP